jgi:formate dehydrogenase subunit gamma
MAMETWSEARANEIIARHATQEGAILPVLHALQNAFGFIPEVAIPLVARALNLSRAEVHGVVGFYADFRREMPGRHVLKLCRGEACQSMGADALADRTRACLNVEWHQTTADRRFTLDPVFCLGLCATAPSAMLDGKPVGRLDAARLDALIEKTP